METLPNFYGRYFFFFKVAVWECTCGMYILGTACSSSSQLGSFPSHLWPCGSDSTSPARFALALSRHDHQSFLAFSALTNTLLRRIKPGHSQLRLWPCWHQNSSLRWSVGRTAATLSPLGTVSSRTRRACCRNWSK